MCAFKRMLWLFNIQNESDLWDWRGTVQRERQDRKNRKSAAIKLLNSRQEKLTD